ncbi:phage tail sheath family protein [Paraburkholderia sp. BL27I4N3]|uniref:phage tail sheath family protein n=1 Tax=Paraburkholderia sp. BL27I4N3 TaxID=1938805 RepID=UPI0021634E08|nr:phage tail sheath family protein [Paraburkholderia sp. BL27I4N3]
MYIEEIERGPRPIEGVPTSIAAFLGETERGPLMPRLVTSYRDFQRWFGGVFGTGNQFLPYAVNGFFENGGQDLYVCRIVGPDAVYASLTFGAYIAQAVGPGSRGNNVWLSVSASTTQIPDPNDKAKRVPVGFKITAAYWSNPPDKFTGFDPFDNKNWKLTPRPDFAEVFDDLVIDPTSTDYFDKRLRGNAALIRFTCPPGVSALPDMSKPGMLQLTGGQDATKPLTSADFAGTATPPIAPPAGEVQSVQGLAALLLDSYRDVSLVYAPYPVSAQVDVAQAVILHCEQSRFRFAAVDCAPHVSDTTILQPRNLIDDSEYAALYYPWLWIADPENGARTLVPPGGYALGVYARVDSDRGVFKAPANEPPRGATSLEYDINDATQATLNPQGVNVIRNFPGRGILIWGARTISSDSLWKYVSVRRLFIFLERSIYEGTQWVVFEPNDPRLWVRVKDSVRLFLLTQWRAGALFGDTEEQAFFITCNRSTMTQDDILNGRLICEIGIAPVRPAEFVIFRIFQNTADPQH